MSTQFPSTRFSAQHNQLAPAFGARKAKQNRFGNYAPNTSLPVVTATPVDTATMATRQRQYWSV